MVDITLKDDWIHHRWRRCQSNERKPRLLAPAPDFRAALRPRTRRRCPRRPPTAAPIWPARP